MKVRWNPTIRIIIAIMLFLAMLWFISVIQDVIGPIIISILLAYLLNPIIRRIRSWTRLHHTLVVSVVFILFVIIIIVIARSFIPLIIAQTETLISELNLIGPQVESLFNAVAKALNLNISLQPIMVDASASLVQYLNPGRIFRVVKAASSNLIWLLIMLVLTFYLMLDWNKIQQRLIDIFPEDYRNDIRQIRDEISAVWQSYFRGQLVLMFTIGMLTGIGLALIGMPMAALFGLLAGALDLIPNLGPTITFVLASMVAYFSGSNYLPISNLLFLFITISLIEIIQMMENFFLQPYIVGRWMKIHPGIVFVSVVGALTLGSALVALIIVPSIVSLAIIFRYIRCMLMDIDPYPIEAESRVVEKPEKIP